jgi:5-(carboxyamino)imidazole ribonucleotide synthase
MKAQIAPGAMLGVLGGGQLGMMFIEAARGRGYTVCVLDPDAHAPAMRVADETIVARYDDTAALAELARRCDAVTTEFENVPATSLAFLAQHTFVAPPASAVAIAQDRRKEKAFFSKHGLPVGPHVAIEHGSESTTHIRFPAILKTATLGYDGKGQLAVPTAQALSAAWDQLKRVPCMLEERIELALEVSVIVARNARGETSVLPVQENQHRSGILDVTIVPARIDAALHARAQVLGLSVVNALDYIGVLCVEMFVTRSNELLLNEIAPRPHNSGHYSIEACDISQFSLQAMTMAGAALPTAQLLHPAVMVNILGDCWNGGEPDWAAVKAVPGTHLHLYGKREARPARKMGHVTCLAHTPAEAMARAKRVKELLNIPG